MRPSWLQFRIRSLLILTALVAVGMAQEEWAKIDDRERLHQQIADEYRQKMWRPWVRITRPDPPLAIHVE